MKVYISKDTKLFVSDDKEIKTLDKALRRRVRRTGDVRIAPPFLDYPKFREGSIYGLLIEDGYYTILNSEGILLELGVV